MLREKHLRRRGYLKSPVRERPALSAVEGPHAGACPELAEGTRGGDAGKPASLP